MQYEGIFKPGFDRVEGGLFSDVPKADLGGGVIRMIEQRVTLLCWADPFFPDPSTPPHVKQALLDAVQNGRDVHYTQPIGSPSLKEKIGKRLARKGYNLDPQRNILITPGSDSGLFYAMYPFISPGDEIMVPDPSYPNNFQNVETMGGTLIHVPLDAANGYRIDIGAFEQRLTPRTKMVALTNPNNPTTTIFCQKDLEILSRFIVHNNLILVLDQAFEDILYDGRQMTEAALLPGMWERTLVVCSASKGMGLSGYRVGYIVACDAIMDKLYGAAVSVIGAANTLAQIAAERAYEDDSFIEEYKATFDRRRRYLYDRLNAVPGVRMEMPQSSFLAWVDVSALGDSSDIVSLLAREAKCLVNDGRNYGRQGEGHIRIVFGCLADDRALEAAVDRIAAVLTARSRQALG